mgnify:FL=1
MKFNHKETVYEVDVDKVLTEATGDDFIDFVDAMGVMVHALSNLDNSNVAIVYNDAEDVVTVYISNEEEDYYTPIDEKNLDLAAEERRIIVEKLSTI